MCYGGLRRHWSLRDGKVVEQVGEAIWSPRHVVRDANNIRVLIYDHGDEVATLCEELELRGFDTMRAASGAHALVTAKAWRPDIAVIGTDVVLGDGFATARELRNDDKCWDVAIIAYTSDSAEKVRDSTRQFEFDAYCQKSRGPGRLMALIERLTPPDLPAIPVR